MYETSIRLLRLAIARARIVFVPRTKIIGEIVHSEEVAQRERCYSFWVRLLVLLRSLSLFSVSFFRFLCDVDA
jgi:hypothetical protein